MDEPEIFQVVICNNNFRQKGK